MSRHRRQQHKRARRARELERLCEALAPMMWADLVAKHGRCSLQSFRWLGVHKGVARAQLEAIALEPLHRVSVRGTITL